MQVHGTMTSFFTDKRAIGGIGGVYCCLAKLLISIITNKYVDLSTSCQFILLSNIRGGLRLTRTSLPPPTFSDASGAIFWTSFSILIISSGGHLHDHHRLQPNRLSETSRGTLIRQHAHSEETWITSSEASVCDCVMIQPLSTEET